MYQSYTALVYSYKVWIISACYFERYFSFWRIFLVFIVYPSKWHEIKITSMIFSWQYHFKLSGPFHFTGWPVGEESWQLTGRKTRHKNGIGIDQVDPTWERQMLTMNWKLHDPCIVFAPRLLAVNIRMSKGQCQVILIQSYTSTCEFCTRLKKNEFLRKRMKGGRRLGKN